MFDHATSSAASFSSLAAAATGRPVPSKATILPTLSATARMGESAARAAPAVKQRAKRAAVMGKCRMWHPHPNPLPKGEGTEDFAATTAARLLAGPER